MFQLLRDWAAQSGAKWLGQADVPKGLLGVRQARYAIFLALGTVWISRRVETFTFLDSATVRRHMSVDFTLPPTPNLARGERALVPLMFLAKEDLRNLDVRGPGGAPLTVLNTAENGQVATVGLQSYLEDLADSSRARDDEIEALNAIVFGRPGVSEQVAHGHLAADGLLGRHLLRADERTRNELGTLIEELEGAFMLLVPIDYSPERRVICKVTYDAANRPQGEASRRGKAYTLANRFLSSIGWAGRIEFFENLAVGLGQSYHAEAVPPRDAYVSDVGLTVRRPGELVDDEPITDDHDFRPHVRVSGVDRTAEGKLSVSIRARSQELVMPLAFTSAVISVVLGLLPQNATSVDRQTFAAVLLVPFAFAAYYIRGQENSYMTRMLRGVRSIAAAPIVCAVYALTLVAIGEIPPPKGQPLAPGALSAIRVLFPVSAIATVILGVAVMSPFVGRYLIRPVMRKAAEQARRALRQHPDSVLRRLANAAFPTVPAILVAIIAILALAYGLKVGVSEWLQATEPSTVISIMP